MLSRQAIAAALAITAIPTLVLALLALTGLLAAGPTIGGIGAILLVGLAFGRIWARDLDRLADVMRRAEHDAIDPASLKFPVILGLQQLAQQAEQLSRTLSRRAVLASRLHEAEEAIVEQLPDPVIVLGADRSVRRANAAARASFGADLPAVLRHPKLRAAIDRVFAQGGVNTAELTIPVPVQREVYATLMFLGTKPSERGGLVVAVLSDRTRERTVERMRADFVANASHELRTPLASLIGFIDTLRGPAADDPPAQRRFLAIMAEQAARMNRLIDDLLSLSRIELSEHQQPENPVDLPALLPGIAAAFEPRAETSAVNLEVDVPAALPRVLGDADQLAQVVQNLLDNALKYGRPGGVVRLSARTSVPGGKWPGRPGLVLSVADDGQGIPRRHLPRVTERFYRADDARSRAIGGTGLGLAIVKHVVNRHRGQLLIESEEGAGTTVRVWFPAAQEPLPVSAPPRGSAQPAA